MSFSSRLPFHVIDWMCFYTVYTFRLGVTSNKNPYIVACLNTGQADIVLTLIVSFNCFNVNKQDH